jgi:sugar phosphate isomerase/epimerase
MFFSGPKYARTAAFGKEFGGDPKKQFWTAAEFSQLVQNLNQAGNTAKMFGYTLCVENAFEGLKGDGTNTFGTVELFGQKGVNGNVAFQVDTANFFCTSRADNSPDDVKAFMTENIKRVTYSHLKTSIDKKPGQTLNDNALPFSTFLELFGKSGAKYVAFELANPQSLEEAFANHQKSIEYLKKNF